MTGICRLSSSTSSNFLTTALTCIRNDCDNNLDSSLLLTPLQLACDLAGQPIPSSDITNAENAVLTMTSPYSVTPGTIYWTSSSNSGYYTPDAPTASSAAETSFYAQTTFPTVATTVSTIVTDSNGNSVQVIVPVTIELSTTIYGTPETQALSTTTDTVAAASSTPSSLGTSITTTTTTSTSASSTFDGAASATSSSSSNSNGDSGGGSPFDQQGGAAGVHMHETNKKSLLGAAVMLAVGVIWF